MTLTCTSCIAIRIYQPIKAIPLNVFPVCSALVAITEYTRLQETFQHRSKTAKQYHGIIGIALVKTSFDSGDCISPGSVEL